MSLDLTDEQGMLADQARRLLGEQSGYDRLRALIVAGAEWDEPLWRELAAMGFLGAAIPEAYGGLGMGAGDLGVIARELGRANAALPFFSSIVLAADAILLAGSEAQKAKWLPRLASGETVATFAFAEGAAGWDATAMRTSFADGKLSGKKSPVADGGIAGLAVVLCSAEGRQALALVELDAAGVGRTKLASFDELRAHYTLTFDAAPAELLAGSSADDILPALFDRAAVQAAFEGVGGAEACLDMARDFAMERHIFGRPLAGYQAIKHKLADIYMAIELARSSTYFAAQTLSEDPDALPGAAAAAHLLAVDAFRQAARENLQIHGGIGYTFEANCHFYYRRERTLASHLGMRQRWGDRLIAHMPSDAPETTTTTEVATGAMGETPELRAYRTAARVWLAANAPSFERPRDRVWSEAEEVAGGRAWQHRLYEGGYAGIAIPTDLGGRGGTIAEAGIFAEEQARYDVPTGTYLAVGFGMALPTITKHGSSQQAKFFTEATLKGEMTWCQLFSEPGAGSDLAAVRARGVRDGDDWIVNGQKVWSSWAHHADWGIVLLRTDPKLPKHRGLSFFVVDMRTPGIDVRPIRQISGASDFNETFLTDVRIPDANRIGAEGEGWACAMTVLAGERLGRPAGVAESEVAPLIALAGRTPRGAGHVLDNDAIRLELAQAYAEEQAVHHFGELLRARIARGENPGAAPAIVKLAYASRLQRTNGLAMEFSELAGIAHEPGDETIAHAWHQYIWSTAMRIAGGADEVLRNQISERQLGMPGEIRTDKTVPFDEL